MEYASHLDRESIITMNAGASIEKAIDILKNSHRPESKEIITLLQKCVNDLPDVHNLLPGSVNLDYAYQIRVRGFKPA
jgi:hypothetical protein